MEDDIDNDDNYKDEEYKIVNYNKFSKSSSEEGNRSENNNNSYIKKEGINLNKNSVITNENQKSSVSA